MKQFKKCRFQLALTLNNNQNGKMRKEKSSHYPNDDFPLSKTHEPLAYHKFIVVNLAYLLKI